MIFASLLFITFCFCLERIRKVTKVSGPDTKQRVSWKGSKILKYELCHGLKCLVPTQMWQQKYKLVHFTQKSICLIFNELSIK